jgi:hypothetical protein
MVCVNRPLDGSSESGMWGYGQYRPGSGEGQVAGTCECGNELSGTIKFGEFLDYNCKPVSSSRRTLLQTVSKKVSN